MAQWVAAVEACELPVAAEKLGDGATLPFNFHALRHAAASLFIKQGWWRDPKKLQQIMGHSSIQVTFDIYGHLFPSADDDVRDMAEIEARLMG